MPFPEKDYYKILKILMAVENENTNNSSNLFGNDGIIFNNNTANTVGGNLFGYKYYKDDTYVVGGSLFGNNYYKDAAYPVGAGIFGIYSNN